MNTHILEINSIGQKLILIVHYLLFELFGKITFYTSRSLRIFRDSYCK